MLEANKSAYDPADLMKAVQLTFTAGVNERLQPGFSDKAYLISRQAFTKYWTSMKALTNYNINPYWRTAACEKRRFVITERGYLGLTPDQPRQGDVLAVLYGGELPVILHAFKENGEYQLVGESYVHGIMNGEALDILANEDRGVEVIALR